MRDLVNRRYQTGEIVDLKVDTCETWPASFDALFYLLFSSVKNVYSPLFTSVRMAPFSPEEDETEGLGSANGRGRDGGRHEHCGCGGKQHEWVEASHPRGGGVESSQLGIANGQADIGGIKECAN
jgi:hypothetical protein